MTTRALLLSLAFALGCSQKPAPRPSPAEAQTQANAIAVGAAAPDAQLVGTSGTKVALAELLHQHAQTVVVFYRGFW
jgi:uncharacterized protein YcfL